ncbi:fimbrial protein [Enterobacter asburiae]|jgi:type 1 fimbria pilin|uniref:fimbrial protein n=1 Tax=Enterobacter asburiae TaxID=61645 RepID=UPI002C94279F|nr:type 1 fimbrial protein [Enterobacter asburiae]
MSKTGCFLAGGVILALLCTSCGINAEEHDPTPVISYLQSANEEHGIVHVIGGIIDAACAISTDSKDQVIELGLESSQALYSFGYGPEKKLVIKLEHCTVLHVDGKRTWKNINVTFLGEPDEKDAHLFSISGETRGIGVQVLDSQRNAVLPGQTFVERSVAEGDVQLTYYVRLATDSNKINDGVGSATIKLRLSYD